MSTFRTRRTCGYGGIGRRARFRFWSERVQVQVLLPAVDKDFHSMWKSFFCGLNLTRSKKEKVAYPWQATPHFSGIFLIIVLLIVSIKVEESNKDIISAIGKAHHTAASPPSLERINAAGNNTTS